MSEKQGERKIKYKGGERTRKSVCVREREKDHEVMVWKRVQNITKSLQKAIGLFFDVSQPPITHLS